MRIGIVSVIREPWGGSEELWAEMAAFGLNKGHEFVHSTLRFPNWHPKELSLIERGLKVAPRRGYIKPGIAAPYRIASKALFMALDKLDNPFNGLFATRPNLVLYNGTSFSILDQWPLIAKLNSTKVPYVILSHLVAETNRLLTYPQTVAIREFYRKAAMVCFVSERIRTVTSRHLALDLHTAPIVRNPVNMSSVERVDFPPQDKPVQLAMVGNLVVGHKGQDVMLEVLASPEWRHKDWVLNIYGGGMDEPFLKDLVAYFGLSNKVVFHGKVSDIRALWAGNHLLLMPSVMEGMPLAVVEAMLCGRPVLATDVGGHTEWIEDGREGFIAAAPTTRALHQALDRAWQSMARWQQMGEAAHNKAMALYDPRAGATLLNLLVQAAGNTQEIT